MEELSEVNTDTELDATIDLIPLNNSTTKIAKEIIAADSVDKTKELINLFNLNVAKKSTLRILKLTELLDCVSDQMLARAQKYPDEFSHTDLINYMKVAQDAINQSQRGLEQIENAPAIIQNQQNNQVNINFNGEEFSKESRDRIADAIKAILSKCSESEGPDGYNNTEEASSIEVVPENINTEGD